MCPSLEQHIYGIPRAGEEADADCFPLKRALLRVRVEVEQLERWKDAAAGERLSLSALVRVSVEAELARLAREAVVPDASSPDPLAELLERYGA